MNKIINNQLNILDNNMSAYTWFFVPAIFGYGKTLFSRGYLII